MKTFIRDVGLYFILDKEVPNKFGSHADSDPDSVFGADLPRRRSVLSECGVLLLALFLPSIVYSIVLFVSVP